MLHLNLARKTPEATKPRRIEIGTSTRMAIEAKAEKLVPSKSHTEAAAPEAGPEPFCFFGLTSVRHGLGVVITGAA